MARPGSGRASPSRLILAVLGLLIGFSAPGLAAENEVREYVIIRDGDEIGRQLTTIKPQEGGYAVTIETDIEVKLAFITLFRFTHRRDETWRDGRLQALAGMTDDDGDEYHLEIVAEGKGYRRTVNGEVSHFDAETGVATLWSKAVAGSALLLSAVSDQVYRVETRRVGEETLEIPRGTTKVEHYVMSGELERELWYDPAGRLVQMRFERDGSDIVYRLR